MRRSQGSATRSMPSTMPRARKQPCPGARCYSSGIQPSPLRPMKEKDPQLSFVIPAKDEAQGLPQLLQRLRAHYPLAEVVVVDDGSSDSTADIAHQAGATV